MKKYNIAIVGATGNIGREVFKILKERSFPVNHIVALASEKSAGKTIKIDNDSILIHNLSTYNFSDIDIAFFCVGKNIAKQYAPNAVKFGAIVIDNSAYFRMDADVPLIVPEVNPEAIENYKTRNIIANPNCSTIQMVVALKPLHDNFHIKRVVVSTYQAVSGAGKKAIDELKMQSIGYKKTLPKVFSKPIAFNVIPHIDEFLDEGLTKEEWKMQVETQKILDSAIQVHANCARVPVMNGHAEYVNIETDLPISVKDAKRILAKSSGIKVIDESNGYVTPLDISGLDDVYISRVRKDTSVQNGLSFWCVADNLRKGAALNAVQIAELF